MNIFEILKYVDHTLLNQTATQKEIQNLCEDAVTYATATVCIPPSFVSFAKECVKEKLPVCTVIGFPHGYHTTQVKIFETKNAIENGASEIDMVINLGLLKDKRLNPLKEEIISVKEACHGKTLKIIVETCFLTQDEKKIMCEIVNETGADYIKTSTGFGAGGATLEDIALFQQHLEKNVKIKASGGIKTLASAQKFIELGVARLGSSALVPLAKKQTTPL